MFCIVYLKKKSHKKFKVLFRNTDLAHILIDGKFVFPSWECKSKKPTQPTKKTNSTTNKPQGTADALAGTEDT